MITIEKIEDKNKKTILKLMKEMYNSDAVDHSLDEEIYIATLNDANTDKYPLFGYQIMDNDKVVGFGFLSQSYCTEIGGIQILFEDLYIDSNYRGLGIGKKYFDFIFKNHRAKRYRLEVTESNIKAIKLYNKLGFNLLNYKQMVKDVI